MTDAFKVYILDLIHFCVYKTGHEGYSYDVLWCAGEKPPSNSAGSHVETTADIVISHVYFNMSISIYDCLFSWFNEGGFSKIGNTILHEICHCFTEPLWQFIYRVTSPADEKHMRERNEQQVQKITNAIFPLLPAGWYTPEWLRGNRETFAGKSFLAEQAKRVWRITEEKVAAVGGGA